MFAPERRRGAQGVVVAVAIALAVAVAVIRAALQVACGIHFLSGPLYVSALITELVSSAALTTLALLIGIVGADLWARARSIDLHRIAVQEHSVQLLRDVQDEELRVRRELAETIHGRVQGTFVVLEAQLRHLAQNDRPADPAVLATLADHLATLREGSSGR